MISLSPDAKTFIEDQKGIVSKPAIVVFEKSYQSWCGPRKYVGVELFEESELVKQNQVTKIDNSKNDDYNVYVDDNIRKRLRDNYQIAVSGFGPFKRLTLQYA